MSEYIALSNFMFFSSVFLLVSLSVLTLQRIDDDISHVNFISTLIFLLIPIVVTYIYQLEITISFIKNNYIIFNLILLFIGIVSSFFYALKIHESKNKNSRIYIEIFDLLWILFATTALIKILEDFYTKNDALHAIIYFFGFLFFVLRLTKSFYNIIDATKKS